MDHDNETDYPLSDCTVMMDMESQRIGLFLLYLSMFIVGLALNVTVVWVNWRRRHSRNTVIFCTLNVSVADTALVLMIPISMLEAILDHVWLWGNFLCRFSNFIILANIYASSFFVAYMTVERYLALGRGLTPKTGGMPEKRKRNLISAALWILSLFLATLETVHVRLLGVSEPGCYVWPEHAYTQWFCTLIFIQFLIQFLVPAVTIATFNTLLARAVPSSSEVQSRNRDDVWVLHVYSGVFVVCWLPLQIIMILVLVDIAHHDEVIFDCDTLTRLFFSYTVVRATALLHCLANPVLYNFLSRSFRHKLATLILTCLPQEAPANQDANQPEAKENAKANTATEHSTSQSEA